MIIATTDRLILRHWQASDRDPFARMNADPRVMEFMPTVLTREQSESFANGIEAHFREHGFGLSAAELRSERSFMGFVGFFVPKFTAHFTPCVEIGWRLLPEYWGQGLATEAARTMIAYASESLRLKELVSFTAPGNMRSRRVMEKLGMTRDPADDFDHPRWPPGHPFRTHVLYRLLLPHPKQRTGS